MISVSPFGDFRSECERFLRESLRGFPANIWKQLFSNVSVPSLRLELPPDPRFGELSSSVCFELAKLTKTKPLESAEKISKSAEATKGWLIDCVRGGRAG